MFIGDPENAVSMMSCFIDQSDYLVMTSYQVEEFIALADARLSVFTGDEDGAMEDMNDIPQHKITNFT